MAIDNKSPSSDARTRITVDVSPEVLLLLDHISDYTGISRSQIVLQAVTDTLPGLVERADAIKRRAGELERSRVQPQAKPKGR